MRLLLLCVVATLLFSFTRGVEEEGIAASSWTLRPHRRSPSPEHVINHEGVSFHPIHEMDTRRQLFERGERASLTTQHEVVIAIKQANLDVLDVMLQERSSPSHPLFRQWLTFDDVTKVVSNPTAKAAVLSWLQENDIHVSWMSARQEYIRASAPISTWNRVLHTEFFEFHDSHPKSSLVLRSISSQQQIKAPKKKTILRAHKVYLPAHLSPHISGLFQTTQPPTLLTTRPDHTLASSPSGRAALDPTPPLLDIIPDLTERIVAKAAKMAGSAVDLKPVEMDAAARKVATEKLRASREAHAARVAAEDATAALPSFFANKAAATVIPGLSSTSAKIRSQSVVSTQQALCKNAAGTKCMTPFLAKDLYNMTVGGVNPKAAVSQAVFASIGQKYSIADLVTFNSRFNTTPTSWKVTAIGGNEMTEACSVDANVCNEANLDMQFIMGVAQNAKTYYQYVPESDDWDEFLMWILSVSHSKVQPDVHSISYGALEISIADTVLYSFNVEALKLSITGVTIVASAGDHGVADHTWDSTNSKYKCLCGFDSSSSAYTSLKGWAEPTSSWISEATYLPLFPASCPYVTAVGGTTNLPTLANWCGYTKVFSQHDGTTKTVPSDNIGAGSAVDFAKASGVAHICSTSGYIKDIYRKIEYMADTFYSTATITSGGGFSAYFDRPSWQTGVADYVTNYVGSNKIPRGFNENGRGYPDISMGAHNFEVVIGGVYYVLDGTSAAAPLFAGMLTLINGIFNRHGLPKLGFINPTLYAASSSFFNDIDDTILQHINNCCGAFTGQSSIECCYHKDGRDAGFPTKTGWDAATGLGSVTMTHLITMFNPAGTYPPSFEPTARPTDPSPLPTKKPTANPTFATSPEYVAVTQQLSGITADEYSASDTKERANNIALRTVVSKIVNLQMGCVNIESVDDVSARRGRLLGDGATLLVDADMGLSVSTRQGPARPFSNGARDAERRKALPADVGARPNEEDAPGVTQSRRSRSLGTSQIQVTYVLYANVTGVTSATVLSTLTAAVSDGTFASMLDEVAASSYAISLIGVTPVAGALSAASRMPSFQPTVASNNIGWTPIMIVAATVGVSFCAILVVAILYRMGFVDKWMGRKGSHTHNICGLASDISERVVKGTERVPHPLDADYDFSESGSDDQQLWRSASSIADSSTFGVDLYADDHDQPQSSAALAASRAAGWRVALDPLAKAAAMRHPTAASSSAGPRAPEEFLCPISYTLMTDPQIAADGNSYERSNIAEYLAKGKTVSPVTGMPFKHANLWPNAQLKGSIDIYLRKLHAEKHFKQEKEVGHIGRR